MQSPDFGNALTLGPYLPCKMTLLGGIMWTSIHQSTIHWKPTMTRQIFLSKISPNCDTNPNSPSQNSFLLYNNLSYLNFFRHEWPEFHLSVKKVDPSKRLTLKLSDLARSSYGWLPEVTTSVIAPWWTMNDEWLVVSKQFYVGFQFLS
jgi:hypothetical protein